MKVKFWKAKILLNCNASFSTSSSEYDE